MTRKILFLIVISAFAISSSSEAQVVYGHVMVRGGYPRPHPQQKQRRYAPPFKPTVNIAFGYGFPNVDKYFLPGYYGTYGGNIQEMGPIAGTLDYQFSRTMSIGIMVTHGTVSAPYYDYNSSSPYPAFTGRFNNWSYMLNLVRYIPVSPGVTPYFRTAVGVNSWQQSYLDPSGAKAPVQPVYLPDFAYQVSFGAKFNLSQNAGIFVEGGYGKYILQGGLALKF